VPVVGAAIAAKRAWLRRVIVPLGDDAGTT